MVLTPAYLPESLQKGPGQGGIALGSVAAEGGGRGGRVVCPREGRELGPGRDSGDRAGGAEASEH